MFPGYDVQFTLVKIEFRRVRIAGKQKRISSDTLSLSRWTPECSSFRYGRCWYWQWSKG